MKNAVSVMLCLVACVGCARKAQGQDPEANAGTETISRSAPKMLTDDQRTKIGLYTVFAGMTCQLSHHVKEAIAMGASKRNIPTIEAKTSAEFSELAALLTEHASALEKLKAVRAEELRCVDQFGPDNEKDYERAEAALMVEIELISPPSNREIRSMTEKEMEEAAKEAEAATVGK